MSTGAAQLSFTCSYGCFDDRVKNRVLGAIRRAFAGARGQAMLTYMCPFSGGKLPLGGALPVIKLTSDFKVQHSSVQPLAGARRGLLIPWKRQNEALQNNYMSTHR